MIKMYHEYIRTDHYVVATRGEFIEIYRFNVLPDHSIEYLTLGKEGLQIRKVAKEGEGWQPWLKFSMFEADFAIPELIDALMEYGFKPKTHTMSEEEKSALKYHLEDMRKIVFEKINKERCEISGDNNTVTV